MIFSASVSAFVTITRPAMVAIKLNIFFLLLAAWTHIDTEPQALNADCERLSPSSEVDKPSETEYNYNSQ